MDINYQDEPIDWVALQKTIDQVDYSKLHIPRANLLKVFFNAQGTGPVAESCLQAFSGDPLAANVLTTPILSNSPLATRKMIVLVLCGILPVSVFSALPIRDCKTLLSQKDHPSYGRHPELDSLYELEWNNPYFDIDSYLANILDGSLIDYNPMYPINNTVQTFYTRPKAISYHIRPSFPKGRSVAFYAGFLSFFAISCIGSSMLYPHRIQLKPLVHFLVNNFAPRSVADEFRGEIEELTKDSFERDTQTILRMVSPGTNAFETDYWNTILDGQNYLCS
jgi:hypothetical protein